MRSNSKTALAKMAERQTEPEAIASSFLVSRPTCSADNAAFDLGISLSESPPRKKKCLSLRRKRFGNPIESPERLTAARGVVPVNTEVSTQWAFFLGGLSDRKLLRILQ